jgi:YidC/Oxa1 family membrane protein insertase
MLDILKTVLYQPLVNALMFFYKVSGNFGIALIALTILIRVLLIPLTLPSMRAAEKIKALAPELDKLKNKYGKDKQKFAKAQLELYQKAGANPAAGCLPQIIQLVILITLYQAFMQVLKIGEISKLNETLYPFLKLAGGTIINTKFLFLDLNKPDIFRIPGFNFPLPGIFLITSALLQFLSSKMMMPAIQKAKEIAQKTPEKKDDMATEMQSQMMYMFPLMTLLIGYSFPSGLVLYWLVFSLFTAVQQYFISGWGGLTPWINKLRTNKLRSKSVKTI